MRNAARATGFMGTRSRDRQRTSCSMEAHLFRRRDPFGYQRFHAHNRAGDSGKSRTSTPSGASAAATALAGGRRHRHHAALAGALGAERIGLGAPQLHGDGAHVGKSVASGTR